MEEKRNELVTQESHEGDVTLMDNYLDMAKKIFDKFEIGKACVVLGYVWETDLKTKYEKGMMVVNELKRLDLAFNFIPTKRYVKNRPESQRRLMYIKNSIGGPVAHKIFRYERYNSTDAKWCIWRVQ